jgi:hypothetical protein
MNLKVIIGAALFATLLASVSVVATTTVPGWFIAGGKPESYTLGSEPSSNADGSNIAYLKSKTASVAGFGTMMQMFSAQQYLGKRVRVSASIRSENVKGWAGLWFRVDGMNRDMLAFDNMQDRSIKGTTDWKRYEVVLDVSEAASNLAMGVLLADGGQVWVDKFKIDVVPNSTPVTGTSPKMVPSGPTNLEFKSN